MDMQVAYKNTNIWLAVYLLNIAAHVLSHVLFIIAPRVGNIPFCRRENAWDKVGDDPDARSYCDSAGIWSQCLRLRTLASLDHCAGRCASSFSARLRELWAPLECRPCSEARLLQGNWWLEKVTGVKSLTAATRFSESVERGGLHFIVEIELNIWNMFYPIFNNI